MRFARVTFSQFVPMPAGGATTCAAVVTGFLQREYGPLRNASKIIGRLCGVSHRTAGKWLLGEGAPQADSLVALMAANDRLAEEIMALVKSRRPPDGDSDP